MTIKKFKAATMKDALLLVKEELGPHAVILNSRKSGNSLFGGERYEITAGLDDESQKKVEVPLVSTYSPYRLTKSAKSVYGGAASTAVLDEPASGFDSLSKDINAMRSAVYSLAEKEAEKSRSNAYPINLRKVYENLEQNEVGAAHITEIIESIKSGLSKVELNDDLAVRRKLFSLVESALPVSGHIKKYTGRARTIALVGPTGVGKTTTIAKLAAHFRLRENMKVALVAADNYRMAAIEQIQQFAGISKIPLEIVYTDEEMRCAMEKFKSFDMVFIDTAGRSQRNIEHMNDLRRTLLALDPDEVHLTISITTKMRDLRTIEKKYSEIGYNKLIITKLDETISYGTIYNIVKESGKPVSYVSTGQSIPDDISLADSRSLANLVAGGGAA